MSGLIRLLFRITFSSFRNGRVSLLVNLRLAFIVLFLIIFVNSAVAQLPGYSYRKKITIDNTKVSGAANLTNFPVLINRTDVDLKTTGNGGNVTNANGYDIRFTTSDGVTLLDHQIENYVATTGEFIAWVRIPSLPFSTDLDIYMHYGNSSISIDPSTSNTWNSNYVGVWNLHDDFLDATSFNNDGTNNGSSDTTGTAADGQDFDGVNDYVEVSDAASLDLGPDFSISLWFRPSATFNDSSDALQGLLDKGSYKLFLDKSDGKLKAEVNDGSTTWATSYNGTQERIRCLAVYDGKLYAGQGSGTGDGDVLVFDGTSWTTSYNGSQESIFSLEVYDGKLYAGQGKGTGDGDVLVFDGSSWTTSYNGSQETIRGLAVYNGKLYVGQANDTGDGDVFVFDGSSWSTSYNGSQEVITSSAVYDGKLYAGQGRGT
ncbi:MAG: DUF2341 domain-containing protein, partial [Bacteroidetes bacterium]|nr:DUF2341 domain-containing protein [Bacteroidota bacterium]